MAITWPCMGTQHANLTEHGALIVEYLKSMQEKIKTSSRIRTEQVEKLIRASIEYHASGPNSSANVAKTGEHRIPREGAVPASQQYK